MRAFVEAYPEFVQQPVAQIPPSNNSVMQATLAQIEQLVKNQIV